MKTQILLSSVITFPRTREIFQLAWALNNSGRIIHGLEFLPYRWTRPETIDRLTQEYDVPVRGIHWPFWWRSKSLFKVLQSEYLGREKAFALVWAGVFGTGHSRYCTAARLKRHFPGAYHIIHPDTFHQMPSSAFLQDIQSRVTFLEPERPKRGEAADTYDPYLIQKQLIPALAASGLNVKMMFDPGHIRQAQEMGMLAKEPIAGMFANLKPAGLHLSMSGEGRLHDLPNSQEWGELVQAIRANPPEVIVIELKPQPNPYTKVIKAREMIRRDLGI